MENKSEYIAYLLLQNYGDLLKVSRVRGMPMPLPVLRKFIAEDDTTRELYSEYLSDEIKGMGLEDDMHIKALQLAQQEALACGDPKNNTAFADELKKLIQAGKSDREKGQQVYTKAVSYDEARVVEFIDNPLEFDIDTLTVKECKEIEKRLLSDFKVFALWAFQIQMGFKFICMDYHEVMFEFCKRIIDGEEGFQRTIINIPPRGAKTQIISILLPLYAFCVNAGSHNMLLSFNESVVLESSGYIRTIMQDDRFRKVFPKTQIDQNKRSLDKWGTTSAGVLHAITANGKVTGRGAGSLSTVFSGIQCIDDILKPLDAYSAVERTKVNDNYTNTLLSRLACDGFELDGKRYLATPQVIIMQRLHDDDLCGHLFRGGGGGKFIWLNIPGIVYKDTGSLEWYEKEINRHGYTHAVPYTYDLGRNKDVSSFWEARKSLESLLQLKEADPYNFNAQYMGSPTAKGTGIVKDDWWQSYDRQDFDYSIIQRTFIVADTASTDKSYSDYSVLSYCGVGSDNKLYILDMDVGKWEVPALKERMKQFWLKHNEFDPTYPRLLPWNFYCEDKSSGHYLIQQIAADGGFQLTPIPRDKTQGDKLARFLNTVPYFAQGRILFPSEHEHLAHAKREILSFTNLGSGSGHDDVVDTISDAVAIAFSATTQMDYGSWL